MGGSSTSGNCTRWTWVRAWILDRLFETECSSHSDKPSNCFAYLADCRGPWFYSWNAAVFWYHLINFHVAFFLFRWCRRGPGSFSQNHPLAFWIASRDFFGVRLALLLAFWCAFHIQFWCHLCHLGSICFWNLFAQDRPLQYRFPCIH